MLEAAHQIGALWRIEGDAGGAVLRDVGWAVGMLRGFLVDTPRRSLSDAAELVDEVEALKVGRVGERLLQAAIRHPSHTHPTPI